MLTLLKNVLSFTGLTVGVPTSLPHGLNVNGVAVAPRLGGANATGFTFTANATNVTATRLASASSGDVNVFVEFWHTIENVLPVPGQLAGLTPFFFASEGGASSSPITNFTHLEDFINTGGFNSKPIAAGTALLFANPANQGFFVGVVNLQATAPGDEISINILFDEASSPINGKATLSHGDGQIVVEGRGKLLTVPTAIDDANIDLLGTIGFAVGPGLFGNQNWWTTGPAFVDTGVLATTAITKFRTEYDSVTDVATWYIDGVLVHTLPAAFGGTGSYSINAHVENISNNTGSLLFLIDYIYLAYTTTR